MKTDTFLGWAFRDKKSSTHVLYDSVRNLSVSLVLNGFAFEVREKINNYGYRKLSDAKGDKNNLIGIQKFLIDLAKSKKI